MGNDASGGPQHPLARPCPRCAIRAHIANCEREIAAVTDWHVGFLPLLGYLDWHAEKRILEDELNTLPCTPATTCANCVATK